MKNNKYILLMILSLIFVTSCDKLLDKDPYVDFTDPSFWSSETNVETYCNKYYDEWIGYGNGGGQGAYYYQTLNDNQASSGFSEFTKNVPATNSTWSASYEEIRRANLAIERIPNISSMSESAKNHWIGVSRLYRAIQHYSIVRELGDCIWVDKYLTDSKEDKDAYLYSSRTDRDVVMDNVLEDLNYAVSNINKNGSSRTAINVNVAQAVKAEICLYEGTFSKYRSSQDGQKAADASRANRYLTECKTACEAIMNSGSFALNSDYQANYNSLDLSGNKEMIMYKKYLYGVLAHSLIDYTCSSTMMSGMSKAAFDSYLFKDGLPLGLTAENTTDHGVLVGDGDDARYNIENLLSVRDPRLSACVDATLCYRGKGYVRFGEGMVQTSSTGYGVYKFDNKNIETIRRNQTSSNETDAPLYTLAEIYLSYAEACAELGQCSQNVLDLTINKLRDRAGMPHLAVAPQHDPANNMNVSDLLWEIRRERRIEMMYDKNDRYWSLIRWHQLDKLDNVKYPDQTRGAWVGTVTGEATVDSEGYIDCAKGMQRVYAAKHYLQPIPSGQLDLNPNLGQNYGW